MIVLCFLAGIGAGAVLLCSWWFFVKLCKVMRWPFACWFIDHVLIYPVHLGEKAYKAPCDRCGRVFLGSFNLGGPMDLIPWTEEMEKEFKQK